MQPCTYLAVVLLQGEDVVAGIRTPEDIDTMRQALPDAYSELLENCEILEKHYKDMMVNSHHRLSGWR
jgi:pyruvate,orthophosphate dikinase